MFLLRTHPIRNAYNLLGLQQPIKATLVEDFDLFLIDTFLEDFKELLKVFSYKRLIIVVVLRKKNKEYIYIFGIPFLVYPL